jgi:predicted RNase H-like HicB family nuclease
MQDTNLNLTAVFQKVPEGYIAFVEELPGANTQGATLEEARENLKEAVALVLEANHFLEEKLLEKLGFIIVTDFLSHQVT